MNEELTTEELAPEEVAPESQETAFPRNEDGVVQIVIDKEMKTGATAVPVAAQPLNNTPDSQADAYRVKRLRDEGKNSVADLLERPDEITDDMKLWMDAHPNFPGLKAYDLRKAMDEGAVTLGKKMKPTTMSDMVAGKEPEEAGGMNFLPEQYYRSSQTLSYFNYDADSDSYQYTNAPGRIVAYAAKGFLQSVAETLYVDPLAEPLTQIEEQAKSGDGETVPEIVGYDKFGAEIWMDTPVNPVQVTPEQVETTSAALRLYTMPESIGKLDLDDSNDLAGLAEGMIGIVSEMALDIMATRKITGGAIFKREKAVNWYRKAVNRFKDLADPTVFFGEFLYAKNPNPDHMGTMSTALAEALEEEFGMEGEVIEWMKSLDDNPWSQAIAITIEAFFAMEFLRGLALAGYKGTFMKRGVRYVSDEIKKAEKLLEAMNVSMGGVPSKVDGADEFTELFDKSKLGTEDPKLRAELDYYVPPRGEPPRMKRLRENDSAFQKVLQWTKQGLTKEGLGWYDTKALRKAFINEHGEKEGSRRMRLYMDMVASTSAGARVPANIKIASHYYKQALEGAELSIPEKGSGYGHKAQKVHYGGAKSVVEEGGLDPKTRPKRATFSENLQGNWAESTVDKHNVRAWAVASEDVDMLKTLLGPDEMTGKPPAFWDEAKHGKYGAERIRPQDWMKEFGSDVDWDELPIMWVKENPTNTEYRTYNELNKRLAGELGITPAQAQAALWLGAGKRTGLGSPPKAFIELFEESVMKTAKELDIEPEEALKRFMAGDERLRALLLPAILGYGFADENIDEGGSPDA